MSILPIDNDIKIFDNNCHNDIDYLCLFPSFILFFVLSIQPKPKRQLEHDIMEPTAGPPSEEP
jgi:hypothetical protein